MKTYTLFKNVGEVDVNAFRLLGASSKETDDTKIGFWGSGLKYALAVLLRNNIEIKAFSGTKEIKIDKRKTKMRGENYEVITINGTPTSITTRAGKDWELWFAIRELYANGLDEEGFELKVEAEPKGTKGETRIFVEMTDEIKEVFNNFNKYFCKNRVPLFRLGKSKVFDRLDEKKYIIYRRGIKVWENDSNMLYDYDLPEVEINESRVITSEWEMCWHLEERWKSYATTEMIQRLVNEDCYEKEHLNWSNRNCPFNSNWLTVLENVKIIPHEISGFFTEEMAKAHVILPRTLCEQLFKQFGNKLKIAGMGNGGKTYNEKVMENYHYQEIDKANEMLKKIEVDVKKFEIKMVNMHEEEILGLVDRETKTILVDQSVFDNPRLLASTLLEEYCHLEYGFDDMTRRFQNHLLKTIINLIK